MQHSQTSLIAHVAEKTGRTVEATTAALLAAVPNTEQIGSDVVAWNRNADNACDRWADRTLAALSTPAASDQQVRYLCELLFRVDENIAASMTNLVHPDGTVNRAAVAKLTRAQASALIGELSA